MLAREKDGKVDLKHLMKTLGSYCIVSVLVERGAEINAPALKAGFVDKVMMFIAPVLMTGVDSLWSIGGTSPVTLKQAIKLNRVFLRTIGHDLMLEGYIHP